MTHSTVHLATRDFRVLIDVKVEITMRLADEQPELLHVMLKPDTLVSGLRDVVVVALNHGSGLTVATRRLTLGLSQIKAIYPRFSNARAMPIVFRYFTSNPTEHLAIVGSVGLHERYDLLKGKTGTGVGIRGQYYTRYTQLSREELDQWLGGHYPNADSIDLEMFARDILHVAENQTDSAEGLRAVLTNDQLNDLRRHGYSI